jgi:hypothetical protein
MLGFVAIAFIIAGRMLGEEDDSWLCRIARCDFSFLGQARNPQERT